MKIYADIEKKKKIKKREGRKHADRMDEKDGREKERDVVSCERMKKKRKRKIERKKERKASKGKEKKGRKEGFEKKKKKKERRRYEIEVYAVVRKE